MISKKYKEKTNQKYKHKIGRERSLLISYFKPSSYAKTINDIDIKAIKASGIKLIICDLDNTLVPHYRKYPSKENVEFIQNIKDEGITFGIISNNFKKRVDTFVKALKIVDFSIYKAWKPFPWKIKKLLKSSPEFKKLKKSEIIIIGDQMIMDTLVANIIGCSSILVRPVLSSVETNNRFLNWLENKIFQKLSREMINDIQNLMFNSEDDKPL